MYRRKIHCSYPHVILYNFFPKISKKVEKIFSLLKNSIKKKTLYINTGRKKNKNKLKKLLPSLSYIIYKLP